MIKLSSFIICNYTAMTVIEIPDEQAAALKARAAAQGLILEDFLRKIAEEEAPAKAPPFPREAAARILELQKCVKPDPEGWTVHDYINHDRP
jgi:plasmid stability protein